MLRWFLCGLACAVLWHGLWGPLAPHEESRDDALLATGGSHPALPVSRRALSRHAPRAYSPPAGTVYNASNAPPRQLDVSHQELIEIAQQRTGPGGVAVVSFIDPTLSDAFTEWVPRVSPLVSSGVLVVALDADSLDNCQSAVLVNASASAAWECYLLLPLDVPPPGYYMAGARSIFKMDAVAALVEAGMSVLALDPTVLLLDDPVPWLHRDTDFEVVTSWNGHDRMSVGLAQILDHPPLPQPWRMRMYPVSSAMFFAKTGNPAVPAALRAFRRFMLAPYASPSLDYIEETFTSVLFNPRSELSATGEWPGGHHLRIRVRWPSRFSNWYQIVEGRAAAYPSPLVAARGPHTSNTTSACPVSINLGLDAGTYTSDSVLYLYRHIDADYAPCLLGRPWG